MSPRPKTSEPSLEEHEIRICNLEAAIKGDGAQEPGALKRIRELEDSNLKNTTTKAVIVGIVSTFIAAAPCIAYVVSRIDKISELLNNTKPAIVASPKSGGS